LQLISMLTLFGCLISVSVTHASAMSQLSLPSALHVSYIICGKILTCFDWHLCADARRHQFK
jgi:hypothetical protein